MTLDYIAGFLDGEGSITLCRDRKDAKFRSPMLSFSNNARPVLEEIQRVLDVGGSIIQKNEKRPNCHASYTLQYKDDAALKVCAMLHDKLRHPAKQARARLLVSAYKKVTPRNGKYSSDMLSEKLAFEEQFAAL